MCNIKPNVSTEMDADNLARYQGGGCWQPRGGFDSTEAAPVKPNPVLDQPMTTMPVRGGSIDQRDKYEREERFEMPTTMLDSLVDRFKINDTRVFGENGKIVVDTGFGNDEVNVTKGKNGGVTVEVNGKKYEFTAEQAKNLEIRGGSGNDTIKVADNVKTGITIRGGSGDDTIKGGRGNDMISGGSGNDKIDGGRGNDWIHAGTGSDTVNGGRGKDTIYAGSGDDQVNGGRGADTIHGGNGADALNGGRGNDHITRDFSDRAVHGGRGDDTTAWDLKPLLPRPWEFDRPMRTVDWLMMKNKTDIRG